MNTLLKIDILISFPLGANFHSNIDEYTYKQFLTMVYHLSCINGQSKCIDCPLSKQCQYYKMTGENFQGYPGVFFKKNMFAKNIFKEQDEYLFTVYFIGNNEIYRSYIDIFFEEYLNHKLAGYYYQLKSINFSQVVDSQSKISHIKFITAIEDKNFIECYNQQIQYYNERYQTHYQSLVSEKINLNKVKTITDHKYRFKTKTILMKGFLYSLEISYELSSQILELGIGKYNYLGGGQIAITHTDES